MPRRRKAELPRELVGVRERFEAWRERREPRARIPEELWAAAVRAGGKHGVHRTARALRLDYMALKRRMPAADDAPPGAARGAAPAFVDVTPPSVRPQKATCEIEVEAPHGAKARIRLEEASWSGLGEFARRFAEARS